MAEDGERRDIVFRGHVQGVGFRWTTQRIASRYSVAGYVKNLPDGNVQLVIEGVPRELDALLRELAAAMEGHIWETDVTSRAAGGEFEGFEIRT